MAASVFFPTGAGVVGFPAQYTANSSFGTWPVLALVRAVGFLAIPLGFSNIHHFIRLGAGSAWARIGIQGLVVSSAGLIAAEGLLAGVSQGTAGGEIVTAAATSLLDLAQVFFFLALAALGIAMTVSTIYPRWSGKGLLPVGVLAAATAVARFLMEPTAGLDEAAAGLAGLAGVWLLAIGAWSAREAWRAEPELSRAEMENQEVGH